MLDSILSTVNNAAEVSAQSLLICTGASLALGLLAALVFMFKNTYSKGFVITLAIMPAIVQLVIMLVNGNLGAGVAVMGAFSLVRFRSVAGSAREICSIFLAMAIGLATGMGYLGVAAIFLLIIALVNLALCATRFGEGAANTRTLKVTIPEELDYADVFDDLFAKYAKRAELVRVKSTNLGSLFELQYNITLKEPRLEKQFLDEIRCRNGNLTIILSRMPAAKEEM